jgi:hypothetical protein
MSSVKGATGPTGSNVLVSVPSGPISGQVLVYSGSTYGASSAGSGNWISGATGPGGSHGNKYEPYIETTIKNMLFANHKDKESGLRNFIISYIKEYNAFKILREAVLDVCPDQEVLLDKLIPLKE